ncbi:hypothetical protein JQC91_09195 [Jannaschia sp. Os4]|uniref:hypothetical protein n=1 Tax=Jannaschia sp. Os4 TaxID=2807617 RepID=UPI00193947C9|nr:hypothetical protein [Jannaschia sp. Os4]MBM2576482.1 hypothetical protein [Jannaschia sp. Os4]
MTDRRPCVLPRLGTTLARETAILSDRMAALDDALGEATLERVDDDLIRALQSVDVVRQGLGDLLAFFEALGGGTDPRHPGCIGPGPASERVRQDRLRRTIAGDAAPTGAAAPVRQAASPAAS